MKATKSIPHIPIAKIENEHVADFLNDNKTVVVACEDKNLWLFDIDKKGMTAVIPDVFTDRVGEIMVMPTGNTILTHSKNKEYCIWKLPDAKSQKNEKTEEQ